MLNISAASTNTISAADRMPGMTTGSVIFRIVWNTEAPPTRDASSRLPSMLSIGPKVNR